MNLKRMARLTVFFVLFLSVVTWLTSCRTARETSVVDLKSMSTGRLLKKVKQNALDYQYLTIRRINVQFSDGDIKTTFKANLKASRNNKILLSISKIGFPVGRILLTPDSVKYVNYMDKNYFVDDYSYLSNLLNIDLDFHSIQSIISNNAFSYPNDSKINDFRNFDSFTESGLYVLQLEKPRKTERMEKKKNHKKVERRLNRLDDEELIVQKMFVHPQTFALVKLIINDKINNREVKVDFDDFGKVEKKAYPASIEMYFHSPLNKVSLKTKMNGFSTDKIDSFNFIIPEKYKQIHVN
ncbi:MAG: DUF4292 domain-containing protein [bacterium]